MAKILILSVQKRKECVVKMQEVLTEAGCIIKTRLGIHETSENSCSNTGLIILELLSDSSTKRNNEIKDLISKLKKIKGVKTKFVEI